MHFPTHEQKQALLEQVLRIADQRLASAAAKEARAFVTQYYENVDPEDLADRAPEDLYGAAMAHLSFARTFASGMPKLRVYNPRAEEHGWSSPHTVIEIVNDDMPFLVDSVTMEVNRQGSTLHLFNHPIFSTQRDEEGHLKSFGPPSKEGHLESLIHVEIDREIEPVRLKQLRALGREPKLLVLTKANARAPVHRPGYRDYVGVKKFDAAGKVIGERRFVGLYTSSAYHADPQEVPLVRRKVARVIERAGFVESSHMYKNLISVLQGYPRDELFQIDEDTLFETALGVLRLGDRRKTRAFIRRDVYGRFYSCLISLPRELYTTDVRVKIQEILKRHLNGSTVEFTVQLSDAVLARIHMLVRSSPREQPNYDVHAIEAEIVQATRRWEDDLKIALIEALGEERAMTVLRAYVSAFPIAYRDEITPRAAVRDVAFVEKLSEADPYTVTLYRPVEADERTLRLRVYRLSASVPLSGSLPVLENMGLEVLDEVSFEIQ